MLWNKRQNTNMQLKTLSSKWALVALGSMVRVHKDLWDWKQSTSPHLYQSSTKVWRSVHWTECSNKVLSEAKMSYKWWLGHMEQMGRML